MNNDLNKDRYSALTEKLAINEELLKLYFPTDIQYDEILEENEKIRKKISNLKKYLKENNLLLLNEMAKSRNQVIDKCSELGEKFIEHFHKIYLRPNDINFNHWCEEMEAWFNNVRKLKLKMDKNRELLDSELRDWFFTVGADYKTVIENANEDEEKSYDDFCTKLFANKNEFRKIIKEHFKK